MRFCNTRDAAFIAVLLALPCGSAFAQSAVTVHPNQGGNQQMEITIPPLNNPNYLDPGPAPYVPGASKAEDYMNPAGGNYLGGVGDGIGSDVDADLLPDSDGAYNLPP